MMFPMVSSLDEFFAARDVVDECRRDLKKEKIPHNNNVPLGMMIELPSVMEIIDELAQASDFFSIGTNDFIQYMLAVDRTNEKVADFYLAHHPAVLRALKRVVEAAGRYEKDVSVCGDMAHDLRYLPFFLGIGIRKISLDPRYLPKIKLAIAALDLNEARVLTEKLISKSKISEISRMIADQ